MPRTTLVHLVALPLLADRGQEDLHPQAMRDEPIAHSWSKLSARRAQRGSSIRLGARSFELQPAMAQPPPDHPGHTPLFEIEKATRCPSTRSPRARASFGLRRPCFRLVVSRGWRAAKRARGGRQARAAPLSALQPSEMQRAGDQSRQRRQPDKGPGMNKANGGNAREISRQLGHNSRNFHENNPNFRRALRFFRAQRPGIRESSSHFRAESQ